MHALRQRGRHSGSEDSLAPLEAVVVGRTVRISMRVCVLLLAIVAVTIRVGAVLIIA